MLVLASCAGEPERDYAVPERLCGLDLGQENYAALFGPGKKLEKDSLAEWGDMHVMAQGCRYLVDGLPQAGVVGGWAKQNDEAAPSTPNEQIKAHNTPERPRRYKGPYEVATWSGGAVAAVDCRRPSGDPDKDFTRFLIDVSADESPLSEDPDRAHEVFGKLAELVMADVVGKLSCQEGNRSAG
ncbi:hypothetical protein [Streptomyces qinglanensis]|uniref:hypothetical protein n=1 Tax=Streptomyces qinglanensis TaxID=943816 RepID=UPI000945C232|nr:hypothetical protein [Streptomyces qinglanensis]